MIYFPSDEGKDVFLNWILFITWLIFMTAENQKQTLDFSFNLY